jgi:glycosyltransferase involved in cell wall biosynthesis
VSRFTPSDAAPDLSVLTPSFGYAGYIRDTLESVARQPGQVSIQHVVQDGGSTDGTVELLREYDGGVVWRSEPDDGQSDALNKAMRLASGRWIGWLNADEFYVPGGVERLVEIGDRTGADVVYGDTAFVDGDGRLLRLVPQHRFSRRIMASYGPIINTVSVVFRRSVLGEAPIDVTMRRMMDWDLYLRLADEGARFRYAPELVGVFRVHGERITATERRGFLQRLNRGHGFGREYALLRDRYGAMRARRVGHLGHGLLKLADGAYGRQLRARRLHGADLRWFASPHAESTVRQLVASCYRERR